ncbi:DUF5686 and carboxypeptidase regulatory-like domain-containing protein [Marinilabilia rubra]|uniref:Carboxypeptidase-like regulatory domain-containing protein n=1 Tax=Marinilabilia rubra TaxID=2162893 RepID=A0A2U2B4G1_9BACT|nr:DUF5686 and carboxypeptidase regulatory-like domain-containing protein [Marinilabilia rubra]PWD97961.1 hypothetical protein DDZ16_17970 [Marinilabilia rubra]
MSLKTTFFLLAFLLPVLSFAQGVRGIIVDETGDPLPMVSIYMPSEQVGTTTNLEGQYEISLEPGEYKLVFRSLGFKQREFKVTIRKTWIDLDLTLEPQSYQLREVVINPSGEDPAYAIMRKAIGMAPYYLRQTERYNAEVYLKGSFRMNKIPRLLKSQLKISANGTEVPIEEGRTYTMESMNEITFIAPDTFKHTVLASRSSFPAGNESTALGFINSSFYEPDNDMVISPLAPQAMRHYKFRYEGYFDEGNYEINKIKVTPKRKSQQLVTGYVYIVQDLWNLHSVDVEAEMFFGDVKVKQVFQPVQENAWLPVTHQFDLDVSMMGVKAIVDYSGSVKYKEVELNKDLEAPEFLVEEKEEILEEEPSAEAPKSENQKKIDELLSREDLNNREMMRLAKLMEKESDQTEVPESLELTSTYKMDVKKDSVKRDSAYWETMRPVPLTPLEQNSFALGDSLARAAENKNDSTDKKETGLLGEIAGFSAFGKRFYMADSTVTIDYDGLIGLGNVNFNPVDGWSYKQSLRLKWRQDSVHQMIFKPEAAWAFSREALMWNASLSQTYAPIQRGYLEISAGDESTDFKPGRVDVAPFADMVASLFFKENYKRYFDHRFSRVSNGIDLSNGLRWDLSATYEQMKPVQNNTAYSFFDKEEDFYPNIPGNPILEASHLMAQNSLSWRTGITYTPRYFYRIRNGRKIMAHSDYPTFSLAMEHGLSAFDSDADYLLVEGSVKQEKEAGFFPALSWEAGGGWFARNEQMHFSRFKHFNGSAIPVRLTGGPSFRLLDDYASSTNEWYVTGDLEYSSPYLLLKNLPVLSNRLWQESLHFNYLYTPQLTHYTQMGYSIDQIFLMGSVGVFAGFENGEYEHWGISAVLEF